MLKAVGYVRLSKEDFNLGKLDESESIVNQRKFISDYVAEQGWYLQKIYVDEDISGSDRDRPSFNEMILDAYAKKFDIIVVKKQARFARDLELIDKYILTGFSEIGIRFVSILDNIDTQNFSSGMRKASQINGLVDQWYLEDLSENIKASFKAKAIRGESISSFPRYGYLKDPEKKGHLIVDPVASKVVVKIFEMYAAGYGETKIANTLNEQKIPSPYAYKKAFCNINIHNETEQSFYWRPGTISPMLVDEIYIGSVVSHRFKKVSYKSKKLLRLPPEEWIVVANCHEPIISMELWNKVQSIKKDKSVHSGRDGKRNPLSGKVICSKCKGKMIRSGGDKSNVYFRCSKRAISKDLCVGSTVNAKQLESVILGQLNNHIRMYVDDDYQMNNITDDGQTLIEKLQTQLKIAQKEYGIIKNKTDTVYSDRLNGVISVDEYKRYKAAIEEEAEKALENIKRLEHELEAGRERKDGFSRKKEILSKYLNAEELTHDIVDLLIEAVYINDMGKYNKEIEVVWKF